MGSAGRCAVRLRLDGRVTASTEAKHAIVLWAFYGRRTVKVASNSSCHDFMITFCILDIVDLSSYLPGNVTTYRIWCYCVLFCTYLSSCLLATLFRCCSNIQAACFTLAGLSELRRGYGNQHGQN